jgi:hypothetical protein
MCLGWYVAVCVARKNSPRLDFQLASVRYAGATLADDTDALVSAQTHLSPETRVMGKRRSKAVRANLDVFC